MYRMMLRLLLCTAFLLSVPAVGDQYRNGDDNHWVLIDTERQMLQLFRGEESVLSFRHVALGRGGAAEDRVRGDNRTPTGEFRIGWINTNSRFHVFLGLDYPTFQHARRAYSAGRISLDEFLDVADAYRERRLPPQTTRLGGNIGIHGLGQADPDLHSRANWTRGCVALRDEEIDKLLGYVGVGTRVVVR